MESCTKTTLQCIAAMFVLFLLAVCLTAKADEFNMLGRAVDLHNYNLMGKFEETGTQVL